MSLKNIKQFIRLYGELLFPGLVYPREFRFADKVFQGKLPYSSSTESELWLLLEFLPSQAVVFDVGANLGVYCYCFTKYGKLTEVHAFEPIPILYNRLKRMFPKVHVYPLALSDKSAVVDFKIPFINSVLFPSRGTLNVDFKEADEQGNKHIKVQTIALDEFLKQSQIKKVDFIKIDVEGFEFNVLKGGMDTLQRFHPLLLVEIEQRHHEQISIAEIFNYLLQFGYSGYFLNRETGLLKSIADFDVRLHQDQRKFNSAGYVNNFIFIHESDHMLEQLHKKLEKANQIQGINNTAL